jgi:ABC-type multidrug transport system ATPase subunit
MTNDDQSANALLQVSGLCFSYPQRELFNNLSIHIPPGVSLIHGEENCGKTSLLRLFAGELAATAGSLQLKNIRLDQQPQVYRQQVFWHDPRADAFDQISVFAYVDRVRQQYPDFDEALLAETILGLALAPHLDKALYMLSTGSKRKVWLAAAFASGAALTLLDAPFAALDQASIQYVMRLLARAADQRTRAWVVSHYDKLGQIVLAARIDLP